MPLPERVPLGVPLPEPVEAALRVPLAVGLDVREREGVAVDEGVREAEGVAVGDPVTDGVPEPPCDGVRDCVCDGDAVVLGVAAWDADRLWDCVLVGAPDAVAVWLAVRVCDRVLVTLGDGDCDGVAAGDLEDVGLRVVVCEGLAVGVEVPPKQPRSLPYASISRPYASVLKRKPVGTACCGSAAQSACATYCRPAAEVQPVDVFVASQPDWMSRPEPGEKAPATVLLRSGWACQ